MSQQHVEFFGPDLGRGPAAASRIDIAVLQIASAIAQLRAPLSRADADVLAHGEFIRQLADRLAPDTAGYLSIAVQPEEGDVIRTSFRTAYAGYSLFDLWLADDWGGGPTGTAPTTVSFAPGTVVETIVDKKRYLVLTSGTGVIEAAVTWGGTRSWFWAATRYGRVLYSDELRFS